MVLCNLVLRHVQPSTVIPSLKSSLSHESCLRRTILFHHIQLEPSVLVNGRSSSRILRTSTGQGSVIWGSHQRPPGQNLHKVRASINYDREPVQLVTFRDGTTPPAVGLLRGDHVLPLSDALSASDVAPDVLAALGTMMGVIEHWDSIKESMMFQGEGKKLGGDIALLAPIPRPSGTIMCIGKNYLEHVKEVDTWKSAPGISQPNVPKYPIVFTKAPQSVIGPEAAIRYPHGVSNQLDYEAELAVIIGKGGSRITRENAFDHVFGYTILNDVTARDAQKLHQQWFVGKSQDTFCPMGPCILPASHIDPHDLTIRCWVDGELRQEGKTSDMIFGIEELIEIISRGITLQPGDILATGTPAGVGAGFDPPRWLTPGSEVKITIDGIGELCNFVK